MSGRPLEGVDCAVCIVRPFPQLWELEEASTLIAGTAVCLVHAPELLTLQGVNTRLPDDRLRELRAFLNEPNLPAG